VRWLGAGGRNDPNDVYTYDCMNKEKKWREKKEYLIYTAF
jgi:hypothetical protein